MDCRAQFLECFIKTFEEVYHCFCFELQQNHWYKENGRSCLKPMSVQSFVTSTLMKSDPLPCQI